MADRKPVSANTIRITRLALMPDRRLALRLMPTDSTKVPKAVLRVNSATAATTTMEITSGIGRNRKLPWPMTRKGAYSVVNCLPLVMIWATPRPQTIRISVAMMGCMPILAIIKPLSRPISVQTTSGTSSTRMKGCTV